MSPREIVFMSILLSITGLLLSLELKILNIFVLSSAFTKMQLALNCRSPSRCDDRMFTWIYYLLFFKIPYLSKKSSSVDLFFSFFLPSTMVLLTTSSSLVSIQNFLNNEIEIMFIFLCLESALCVECIIFSIFVFSLLSSDFVRIEYWNEQRAFFSWSYLKSWFSIALL